MTQVRRTRTGRAVGWTSLVALLVCLAGCGGGKRYANNPRPPAPIVITAAIVGHKVSVSPTNFGAGPIELIVTNQTGTSQQLTLETNELGGSNPGLRQQTGPINPQDTASLKATVRKGTYSVHVENAGIRPATLQVGAARASAQNELLQP